ncbi:hypothetical protein E3P86_03235 [Wallemia ichthyophaga]|uniref:Uncharacterized protein n=1 Tax=Wallemia ichthyophaga TaxID=245174 RepID=A0A4T0IQ03_WALIC|nr:hypothetical protein E3P86_03235 [Wallemia ichthyophaga]
MAQLLFAKLLHFIAKVKVNMEHFDYIPQKELYFTLDNTNEKVSYWTVNSRYVGDNKSIEVILRRDNYSKPFTIRIYDRRYDQNCPEMWNRDKEQEFRQALKDGDSKLQAGEVEAWRACNAQFERDLATMQTIKSEPLYCVQQFVTTVTFEISVAPPGHSQKYFTARGFLLEGMGGALPLTSKIEDEDAELLVKDACRSFDKLAHLGICLAEYDMNHVSFLREFGLEAKFQQISNCLLKNEAVSPVAWKADVAHHRILFKDAVMFAIDNHKRKLQLPNKSWVDDCKSVKSGGISSGRKRKKKWKSAVRYSRAATCNLIS